jgi:hypothetical protein
MDDTIEIEIELTIDARKTRTIKIDREEWEEMSSDEQEKYMSEEMDYMIAEQICADWKIVD